jgi:hypothetical protein
VTGSLTAGLQPGRSSVSMSTAPTMTCAKLRRQACRARGTTASPLIAIIQATFSPPSPQPLIILRPSLHSLQDNVAPMFANTGSTPPSMMECKHNLSCNSRPQHRTIVSPSWRMKEWSLGCSQRDILQPGHGRLALATPTTMATRALP